MLFLFPMSVRNLEVDGCTQFARTVDSILNVSSYFFMEKMIIFAPTIIAIRLPFVNFE